MPSNAKAMKAKTAVVTNPVDANETPDQKSAISETIGTAAKAANHRSTPSPSLKTGADQAKPKPESTATKSDLPISSPRSETSKPVRAGKATIKAAAKATAAAERKASKPGETEASRSGSSKPAPTEVAKGKDADEASTGSADALTTSASASERSAQNKNVAAALMAARRNTRPAAPQARETIPQSGKGIDTVKGTVEVADKNVKKAVVEQDTREAPVETVVVAPVAAATVSNGMMRRPGLPQRGAVSAPPADKAGVKSTKPAAKGQGFKTNEFIVYPAHGVGEIIAIEEQVVAGYKLELFVISFIKDKMILKVPLPKIASVGMRKLAEPQVVKRALDTLTGRARIKRTMWSRRAQEYEAKINSGDLVAIAEVVRDLYRSDAQPEQSYSERQLYEAALDRMAREISVVQSLTDTEALKVIDEQLRKGPRRGKAEETETEEGDEPEDVDGEIGAAA